MSISEFTFKLFIIFMPGMIAFMIIDNFTIHREVKTHHRVVYSLILGIMSYIPWNVLCCIYNITYNESRITWFNKILISSSQELNLYEISMAAGVSISLGVIISYILNSGKIYEVASYFNITENSSNMNIWLDMVRDSDTNWIRVRDITNNRIYQGLLLSSSTLLDNDALLLGNVSVYYEDTAQLMYSVEKLYLQRKFDDIIIEVI